MIELGLDPALGGGNAMVVADLGEKLTILDCRTDYDLSQTEEQLLLLDGFCRMYRPTVVTVEFDAQQKGLGNDERLKEMSRELGFSIRPHLTRGQKMDEIFGVASMDQSFKKGEIRIPYADQRSQDRMANLLTQLRAWRPDVKTKNLTQDLVMALWFVWKHWMTVRKVHEVAPAPAFRPSWIFDERGIRGRVA
jgi:hypothetical protein